MNKVDVRVKDFDEEKEVFKVVLEDTTVMEVAKADMSIYQLKEPMIEALLNQVITLVNYEGKLTRIPLMKKRLTELTEGPIIGRVIPVSVVSATNIALYCDMGDGISGIMHSTDIVSCPISNPTCIFPIGAKIEAKIKKYDEKKAFFTLSYRDMFKKDITVKKGQHIVGIIRDPFISRNGITTGYYVQVTQNSYGILDSSFTLRNGEKIPMIVHEVSQRGIRLRHEFPN